MAQGAAGGDRLSLGSLDADLDALHAGRQLQRERLARSRVVHRGQDGEELAGLEVAAQGQGDVAVRLGVAGDASAAGPDQRAFRTVLEVLSPQDAPFPQKLRFSWRM